MSSEGRKETEELGEKVGEELKVAARKEELTQEEWESRGGGGGPWWEVKEEMRGVMEYLRQMDQKLQEVSGKAEKLEEVRRRETEK